MGVQHYEGIVYAHLTDRDHPPNRVGDLLGGDIRRVCVFPGVGVPMPNPETHRLRFGWVVLCEADTLKGLLDKLIDRLLVRLVDRSGEHPVDLVERLTGSSFPAS